MHAAGMPAWGPSIRRCTVRLGLSSTDAVDDEVVDLLAESYAANL